MNNQMRFLVFNAKSYSNEPLQCHTLTQKDTEAANSYQNQDHKTYTYHHKYCNVADTTITTITNVRSWGVDSAMKPKQ